MAENRSINILVNLIDNVSDKADNIQRKLNGLENRRKAYEKAEREGDRKRAAELRKSYKEDREAALAELEKLNKQKEKYLSRLATEESRERAKSVRDEQKASDAKIEIAKKKAESENKIREEQAKAETERAKASIKTAKGEADEKAQIARSETLRVEGEERRQTRIVEQEENRRTIVAREEAKNRSFLDREEGITAQLAARERIRNEARAENRRLIRQERELIKIQKQQQLEYERTATFLGRARYQKQLLGEESNRLTVRLSRVGLAVRGVVVANALVFARALISVFVALAGQAVALAGSLVYAAGALGGAFVAAASQALPVIGLLGAAMSRLSVIQDAVNQNDLMQKQQFGDTGAAGAASDAAQQVADAQEAVKEAQENLTKARKDAKRELRDLILSEKEAELAFRRSSLSQREARAALRERIATGEGSYLEFQSDMLSVPEARLSRRRSRNELTDTRQDLARALKGGIEGMDGVKSATKALADAQRQLAQAQSSATSGMDSQSAAARNLQFFLSELTPTERKVYKTFIGFRDRFREVMSSVTDILFETVLGSFGKIEKAIFNPKLLSGFRTLAKSIGGAFKELIGVVTSRESINFWDKTLGRASGNIRPLTRLAKTLYQIFMNLADAAGPAFKEILSLINGEFEKFEKTTSKKSGVTEFFDEGINQLKAWGRLIGSLIDLFGALFGASSDSAMNTLDDLTSRIDKATAWIRENPKQVEEFFMNTSIAFGYLIDIVEHLGAAMLTLFDASTIETFSIIIDDVLIPALVMAIEWFSVVVEVFEAFVRIPLVPQILGILGAVKIFTGSLGLLLSLLKSLVMPLWRLANVLFPAATAAMKKFFSASFLSEKIGKAVSAAMEVLSARIKKGAKKIMAAGKWLGAKFAAAFRAAAITVQTVGDIIATRFRRLSPRMKKLGGILGTAVALGIAVGMIDALRTKSFWEEVLFSMAKLGAAMIDALGKAVELGLEVILKSIRDSLGGKILGKIGLDIPTDVNIDIGMGKAIEQRYETYKFDREWRGQMERQQRNPEKFGKNASDLTAKDIARMNGETKRETRSVEENTKAKRENRKAVERLNKEQEESARASRRAARRQSEQREETKRNRFQQSMLENSLRKVKDGQQDLDRKTKGATKRGEEQRKGARKLAKGLRNLDNTTRGVGGSARGLGQMFGDVTNKLLNKFGVKEISFSLPAVNSVFKAATSIGDTLGGMFAQGGYFGDKSLRNHDDRLIAVAGGEAILTGYHQPEVNRAMAFANAYGVSRYNSLDSMFSNERRPHYTAPPAFNNGGKVPGFATGGYPGLSGDLDFGIPLGKALSKMAVRTGTPIYVQDGGRTLAEQAILYQRFLNGTGNLAAPPNPNAPHIRGIAADITPGSEVFGGVAGQYGLGFTVPGESWHIELLSGASYGMGAVGAAEFLPQIQKIKIDGPKGPYKSTLMGEEKVLREAANEFLKENLPLDEGGTIPLSVANLTDFRSINKIFPEHNSAYGDWGGVKLPFNLVAALAQAVGLPGITFAQIAIGESGLRPGATGIDPGGTKGLGLWMITTGFNDALIASFGGEAQMRNPVKNAMAAKMIYDSNGIGAWYGTGFVTDFNANYTGNIPRLGRRQTGGLIPEFNDGGIVPGRMGEPVLAKVHAGETILPTHKRFATGGVVPRPSGNNNDRDKNKEWEPKAASRFTKGFLSGLEDLNAAFKGLSVALKDKFKPKSDTLKKELKNLDKRLEKFFEGIATANRELEELIEKQTRKLNMWAYKVVNGYAAQVKSTEKITARQLKNLREQYKYLQNQERMVEETRKDLQKQFKATDKDQKNLRKKLRFAMKKAAKEQEALQNKISENIMAQIEAQRAAFEEAMNRFDIRRSALDLRIRIQEALGQLEMGEGDEINPNQQSIIDLINKDTGVLESQRTRIEKELARARKAGDTERVRELEQQLLENQLAIIENSLRVKELTEATNENTDSTDQNTGVIDFRTTSWDRFRFAVLQGAGINPELAANIPALNSGGYVAREGLAYLHSAEVVVPADKARMGAYGNSGPLVENINFTQPMEVADPVAISSQIGFKLSTLKSL